MKKQPVSELPLLTQQEQHQLQVEWNNTCTKYPLSEKCVHELFQLQVEQNPEAVAVEFENSVLTYRELNDRANQLAHYLQAFSVSPDVLIGIYMERSIEMVVGLLGILKAGGAYLPLDPTYPAERIAYMVADSQISVLLTQNKLVDQLPKSQAHVICVDTDWEIISQKSEFNLSSSVDVLNLAYVIYTSGSTGKPKGVAMRHTSLCNLILWQLENTTVDSQARTLQFAPISFDVSFQEMFSTWCSGGTLVLISELVRREPMALLRLIAEKKVARLFLPFVALQQLAEVADSSGLIPTSLREIVTAGEQLQISPSIVNLFNKLKDCVLHNHYGPSESHVVTAFTLTGSASSWQKLPSIGRPIANTQIYILDEHLQPVPIGVAGEIYIGGISLARGYFNRPDLTEQRFIPNPFENIYKIYKTDTTQTTFNRLYKTGDKARYLSDGNIEYLGRIDNQVKIRGFRIELGEIEAALIQHPAVRETVVMAREDSPGDKRLVAYVVPKPQQAPTISELRNFLQQKLADYMVPTVFVMLEALPLTPSGKVDRRALHAPDKYQSSQEVNFVAPRNQTEKILATIWAQVLRLKQVGIYDNFIQLGGDSLLATQIMVRVRHLLQVELSISSFFESPTVAGQAEIIEANNHKNLKLINSPIQPVLRSQSLPLSFSQQQLWFLCELYPQQPIYNETYSLRLGKNININALEQSFTELIRRHEALRTTFMLKGKEPFQVIHPPFPFTLPVVILEELSEALQEAEALQLATAELQKLFDLTQPPLLRATLIRMGNGDYRLFLALHHLIMDEISMYDIFFPELEVLYTAFCAGKPSPLPELEVQYADFASWQQKWFQEEILSTQLDYWKNKLADLPTLQLPTDRPRPATATFVGTRQCLALSQSLTDQIKALSRQEGVTLFTTLAAAINVLLYRYCGQEDIVMGTVVGGRNRPEIEKVMGNFLNVLVLRTDLSADPSFREVLNRSQEVIIEACAHQDLPFQKLVAALQPQRLANQNPLFQVAFVLESPLPEEDLQWSVSQLDVHSDTSKFDLTFELDERKGCIIGRIEYNTDLFDAETISRMIEHFQTLLEGIVADPNQNLSELPLLMPDKRRQLLLEPNNTKVDYPQYLCIHQLFEEQVEKNSDAVAVVFEDEQLTYRELNGRANQLARYLQSLGAGAEVLVGICVERSLDMVIGLLAILKAGAAYVPLDPAYPKERLAFMLNDANTSLLLTQQHLVKQLPEHKAHVICLDNFIYGNNNKENLNSHVTADNSAYVIYTSGSTGKPKGVVNTHRGIINRLLWMQDTYHLKASDSVLQKTPFSFDVSVWEFFWPLLAGSRLVVAKPGGHQDSAYLVRLIAQQKITTLHFVPSMLQVFLQEQKLEDCSCLRQVFCSGEALPFELQERFFGRLGAQLHNLYGPTEAAIDVTFWQCEPDSSRRMVPIGRPIANTQTYILDSFGQPVPIGVFGELYIGGVGLARGYFNRPDLTAEKFIPNPFSNQSERLYKTGDKARYLSDGTIEYLGRLDHQVKLRGLRIELGEIEAVLAQHPQVLSTAVIVREDQPGNQRLVAYVVSDTQQLTVEQLLDFLQQKLPDYMVPKVFVFLPTLPLTPNGKLDRRALPAPQPELNRVSNLIAPSTPTQKTIAAIWSEVLGLEEVSINDNFFNLGGHSLLATIVVSRMQTAFGQQIPMRRLFEFPTIAKLAELIGDSDLVSIVPELVPISRDTDKLPLSFAQTRLWFLNQLEKEAATYNMPIALRVVGKLDVTALEMALLEIIRRHEVLRTSFQIIKGEPVQVINPTPETILSVVNLQGMAEVEQRELVQNHMTTEAQKPFHLSNSPLLRATLLQLGNEEHVLLMTMHHIASDGWSMGIFTHELSSLYEAFSTRAPSPLPELPIQYADFAIWQRQWLSGSQLEAQLNNWKQQLAFAPSLLSLPTDRPRPAMQTFCGGSECFELNLGLKQQLLRLSQDSGATLFMTLLAAFKILLSFYSGQSDIIVGSPIANRNHSQIESLIGFFVNTLVLRTNLEGNPTFKELLTKVRQVALDAYTHQDLPFEKLVESLQLERNLSHNPLFNVMFVLNNGVAQRLELPGLTISSLPMETVTVPFDLTLSITETELGLFGELEYNSDLFDADTIKRMAGHFLTLLGAIVANPNQNIQKLSLLTRAEQHQLLVEWNNTQTEYPEFKCVHQMFEAQVELTPDAIAVEFENQQLTYRELNIRANQVAHYLQVLGVKPDVFVGICVERNLEMVVGMLGILKAGGAYVPLEPEYPQERLSFMLEDAGVPILLTQQKLVLNLPKHQAQIVCLDTDWEIINQQSQENPISKTTGESLAYTIYTSGTTGKPKGVLVEHRNLTNCMLTSQAKFNFTGSDRMPCIASFAFDIALFELFCPLLAGATLILLTKQQVLNFQEFAQYLKNVTCIHAVPSLMEQIVAFLKEINLKKHEYQNIKKLFVGGDLVSTSLLEDMQNVFSDSEIYVLYGPTEGTIISSSYLVPSGQPLQKHIIGRPLNNIFLRIYDKNQTLVPIGVPGELYIGGAGVTRGYLNREELTQEKYLTIDNQKFYRTGDLVRYLPNAEIEFLDRVDHQVKIRGFRIELKEIEMVLNQHPEVQKTVVIAREHQPGNQRLVAYVVPHHEQAPTKSELRSFLQQKLPEYMVPSAFVMLSALPLTPNGKVDRRALPEPDTLRDNLEVGFVAPRTPTEQILAAIWAELLKVEVGINDNFFELGGHSLLATQVISRLREAFCVQVHLQRLFEYPTVAKLGEFIKTTRQGKSGVLLPPIEPVGREENLPLSFAQARLWFLNQLNGGSATYNMPMALRLNGSLNVTALEMAVQEILRRHEALRTNFHIINDLPVQVIAPSLTIPLSVINLDRLPEGEQSQKVQQLAQEEAKRPFDLANDSLLRVTLLQLGEESHVLLLNMHHIVSDGWSMGIFIRELTVLYNTFSNGTPSPLPEPTIQYADFAVWQRQWQQGEYLQTQLSYWKKQLDGIPVLKLPTDRPRPIVETFRGSRKSLQLPKTLSDSIEALSRNYGATVFMILVTAFKIMLHYYTYQDDIVIGTDVANRNRVETEEIIGFFANQLVLRTDLSGNPEFKELLGRVRKVAMDAYNHQDLPFDKLVATLNPERDLNSTPLFQVKFVLQNAPMPDIELSNLTLNYLEVDNETAKFDLLLNIWNTPQGMSGLLEYRTDLFNTATITQMLEHFETILRTAITQPNIRLNALLTTLKEADKQQLAAKQQDFREISRKKLKNIKPQIVNKAKLEK